ncbi:hypothetical protein CS8_033630 [Cupriavidus sp. 8B]
MPKAVADDIRKGGDNAKFAQAGYAPMPGGSYRDMWWVSPRERRLPRRQLRQRYRCVELYAWWNLKAADAVIPHWRKWRGPGGTACRRQLACTARAKNANSGK